MVIETRLRHRNDCVLVVLPVFVVMAMVPDLTPVGAVTTIRLALCLLNFAGVPLNGTERAPDLLPFWPWFLPGPDGGLIDLEGRRFVVSPPRRYIPIGQRWNGAAPRRGGRNDDVGRVHLELVGVEGLGGWLEHLWHRWNTVEGREVILYAAQAVESEPSLLSLSAHLLAVTRRPS